GAPISGTVIQEPGRYHFPSVADGVYYILAAGLARSKDLRDYFLYETTLRGGGQPILIRNGVVEGSTDLSLRSPEAFDPPILTTLPLLLAGSAQRERHELLRKTGEAKFKQDSIQLTNDWRHDDVTSSRDGPGRSQ
ncbi:MAG TPA: hypothetical protein VF088_20485, partial [Pyrinomonadaceae bacterium]